MPRSIVHLVAAARPNFMKIAPLYHALSSRRWCRPRIVHTGQHYDANMSDAFFRDLGLPNPAFPSRTSAAAAHAEQTAGVMVAYEKRLPCGSAPTGSSSSATSIRRPPAPWSATKLLIPVAHLEAGLRSGDRTMPEEINRLVTDAICDVLWTPSPDADEQPAARGRAPRTRSSASATS